jgi:HK97 family phage portal protein
MKFLDRIKCAVSQTAWNKMLSDFMSGSDIDTADAIGSISGYNSMKFTAVFACLRVLAETFCSVPVAEYKKLSNGDREKTDDTGVLHLFRDAPNSEMDVFNFLQLGMYQVNTGGNFVCERKTTRYGEILELIPYDWQKIQYKRDDSKRLVYEIDGVSGEKKYRSQVFHVAGPSTNGIVGLSPLEYAGQAVRLGLTYENFGINFYRNGALPTGVFGHPKTLNDEAFERLKKTLKEKYTGPNNAGGIILTEDNLSFTPIQMKLVDAELLSSKKFQIEDICRIYRVPLHLVQNLDKATNNNIEHQSLEFAMYTMLPWYKRWESAINGQLLTPEIRKDGYYYEFNLAGLLRGDQASMAQAFATGRQWGWLSVNDIRRMLNMNAIPGGDIYLQPSNMIEAGTKPDNSILDEVLKIIEQRR